MKKKKDVDANRSEESMEEDGIAPFLETLTVTIDQNIP